MVHTNIDGAVKNKKNPNFDMFSINGLSFLKELISLQNLDIDGADYYEKCKGWKKFQRYEH